MRSLIVIVLLLIDIDVVKVDKTEKVRYLSTEHPRVLYYNPKYISYANLTSQRYGRGDPFYYVGLHADLIYSFHNNWTVDFIFYEFLTNRYRRSFVEMHFKLCDLIHNDQFFGSAMKQGKLDRPCPYPPGSYNLYNMTVPLKHIPHNFPFTKGRIFANVTGTHTKEHIASGQIDMEIKETRLKMKPN